jgi:hypothetical protein
LLISITVNSFANIYRIGSTNPTTSLDEGDLFYNSTDNTLKYYNGSAWTNIEATDTSNLAIIHLLLLVELTLQLFMQELLLANH